MQDIHANGSLLIENDATRSAPISSGETSKAVFDCLAHGVPTIVNAHGSLRELHPEAALILPDEFEDVELAAALEPLHDSPELRDQLRLKGEALIRTRHVPATIAEQYWKAMERFAQAHRRAREEDLLREIGAVDGELLPSQSDLIKTAAAVAQNRDSRGQRQILLDVSATAKDDLKTGIERGWRGHNGTDRKSSDWIQSGACTSR